MRWRQRVIELMVVLILEGLELVSWFDLGDSVRCEHNLLNRGIVFMLGMS